jgi:excisionase family DNA binding protein
MKHMMEDDELLTTAEMAKILGVSPNTLEVWRSTGRYALPFVKVGRLVRYKRSAGAKFLEKNTSTKVQS